MGFLDGKLSVFRLGLRKDSSHSTHPQPASPSRTHDRQHRHRKRRFHVSQQALGVGFHNYSVAAPAQPTQRPAMPEPPPQPATEPLVAALEAKTLSDQEVTQQPARSGMRICAWILCIVLLGIQYKKIIAIWVLAARAWPNL